VFGVENIVIVGVSESQITRIVRITQINYGFLIGCGLGCLGWRILLSLGCLNR